MNGFPRAPWLMVATATALLSACERAPTEPSASPSPASVASAGAPNAGSAVARIVFVDQAEACDCTMQRIAGTWTALQGALGEGSQIPVERIHRDTQEAEAEEYRLMRPMVTVPGIYLLDGEGELVELLQGEVTEDQVRAALGGAG